MEKSKEAIKKEEQHIHTAVFAIIVGVLITCLERAVVVSLVEQWRARVFLLLNLVILLAVVLTSLRLSGSKPTCDNVLEDIEHKLVIGDNEEEEEEGLVEAELSEEELKERVEAFISMFRQHLLSDSARKTRVSPPKILVGL